MNGIDSFKKTTFAIFIYIIFLIMTISTSSFANYVKSSLEELREAQILGLIGGSPLLKPDPKGTNTLLLEFYNEDSSKEFLAIRALGSSYYEEVLSEIILRALYEVDKEDIDPTKERLRYILYMDYISIFLPNLISITEKLVTSGDKFSPEQKDLLLVPNSKKPKIPESQFLVDDIKLLILSINKRADLDLNLKIDLISQLIVLKNYIIERNSPLPSLRDELNKLKNVPSNYKKFVSKAPVKDLPADQYEKEFNESTFLNIHTFDHSKKEVQRIKESLEKNVIEQPEVIEHLLSIERSKALRRTQTPHVFATIGLPGTGKDTIAESYVQAMHPDDPKAIEKYLYRFVTASDRAELWHELGSPTGYTGSETPANFIEWAVGVSGGKYTSRTTLDGLKVQLNDKWKGQALPNTISPDKAVVFINEFHNWSKYPSDHFLKQFIEKGIITINNPNGGVSHLELPFTVQIASNHAITSLADRNIDGSPRGSRSQSYKDMMKKWYRVHKSRRALVREIMKPIPGTSSGVKGDTGTGKSEELVNRFQAIFVMRPISPEGIQKIAKIKMNQLKSTFKDLHKSIGQINLSWTHKIIKFLQEYQYNAEENARPVKDKIDNLIRRTLDDEIFKETINPKGDLIDIQIDVKENENGTYNLVIKTVDSNGKTKEFETLMEGTNATQYNSPLTAKEREKILNFGEEVRAKVAGLEFLLEKIENSIISNQMDRNVNLERAEGRLPGADVFGFFGLSSTGKTELAKVIAEVLTGDRKNIWEVEANHLQTEFAWEKTFGFDSMDPSKLSEFQKEYDKRSGQMVVVLDELTNIKDKSLLQKLYPYLRESEVGGRPLANVIFILTGNSGQEIYQGIPPQVPKQEKFYAFQKIFKKFFNNEQLQEDILNRDFPEPLVKRMGLERAFFFPPFTHQAIKSLFQIKLKDAIEREFTKHMEKHWWNLKFKNPENFNKLLDTFADEGFKQSGQGDSINRYANIHFARKLKLLLFRQDVSIGSDITVSLNENKTQEFSKHKPDKDNKNLKGVYLNVETESGQFELFLEGEKYDRPIKSIKEERISTAYHEVGHEVVGKALKGDLYKSTEVSIVPGVAEIEGKYLYYAGIRSFEQELKAEMTRELMIQEIAGLLGGDQGESLTTKGERTSAGKHNDIERASNIARRGVLEFGLSKEFGLVSKSKNETIEQMEAKVLLGPKASLYQKELDKIFIEGQLLARESILINWETFVAFGKLLSEKGELDEKEIEEFYKNNKLLSYNDKEFINKQILLRNGHFQKKKFLSY